MTWRDSDTSKSSGIRRQPAKHKAPTCFCGGWRGNLKVLLLGVLRPSDLKNLLHLIKDRKKIQAEARAAEESVG